MAKTGATVQAWGVMYNAVEHSVLLYGSESWVVIGEMIKVLDGFHHWEARRIIGIKKLVGRAWSKNKPQW